MKKIAGILAALFLCACASQPPADTRTVLNLGSGHSYAQPRDFCQQPNTVTFLLSGLHKTPGMEGASLENISTSYTSPDGNTFSCHVTVVTSTGTRTLGTITNSQDAFNQLHSTWASDAGNSQPPATETGESTSNSGAASNSSSSPIGNGQPQRSNAAVRPATDSDIANAILREVASIQLHPDWHTLKSDKLTHGSLGYTYEFTLAYRTLPDPIEAEADTESIVRSILRTVITMQRPTERRDIWIFVCAIQDGLQGETGKPLVRPLGCSNYNSESDQVSFDPNGNSPPSWLH